MHNSFSALVSPSQVFVYLLTIGLRIVFEFSFRSFLIIILLILHLCRGVDLSGNVRPNTVYQSLRQGITSLLDADLELLALYQAVLVKRDHDIVFIDVGLHSVDVVNLDPAQLLDSLSLFGWDLALVDGDIDARDEQGLFHLDGVDVLESYLSFKGYILWSEYSEALLQLGLDRSLLQKDHLLGFTYSNIMGLIEKIRVNLEKVEDGQRDSLPGTALYVHHS